MSVLQYHPPTDPWLDISYQDDAIMVINKPSGLLSVPGRAPEHHDSVWSRVKAEYPEAEVVHRLDMSTSGLMLIAKTKQAERSLKKQFQYRLTHKVYYARVWGRVEQDSGEIDLPLICDWPNRPLQKVCYEHGKTAQTRYEVIEREANTTLVRLLPITGRSHQLRVHMLAIGHPIIGDGFYAHSEAKALSPRLQLHAAELTFYHPSTEQLEDQFVACDFYQQAAPVALQVYSPQPTLPDYKSLPPC
ncbi:bifunctional tRNA pseudouridine(32) synthase/23S rRNA pseudouridine(746) synthase RluA [Vibrio sp. SCSIO 43136]|uniref:bifunctional tRNA pseudouridine(32) synthase/23S rRNA pseudouridine(746) synthase RluA n=1 Tax=Vibrio sp. SCSIO 43136 TaxID=2819101 RepID=UPI0020751359|nr:bifunctional tRNA pseudouridine(32) synthase/23S rRNA pseudouridine(746) synthase RluA [Vibrio sp. SCSIO 43136]USD64970.1 bifunctional tRNA pseudouridine(32) synthase/23S rRNA pseudouridine(746) synthase RluA [Vibrio sp. SCSIO 43136]